MATHYTKSFFDSVLNQIDQYTGITADMYVHDDIVDMSAVSSLAKTFGTGRNSRGVSKWQVTPPNYELKPTVPQAPAPMFRLPAPGTEKWPEYLPPYTSKLGPPDPKVVKTWVTPEQYSGYRNGLWTRNFGAVGLGLQKIPEPFHSTDNSDYKRAYQAALQGELFCMLKVDSISTQIAVLRLKHEL